MIGIGKRIELHRKEMNLSQKELGMRCNVGQATISSWEKERTEPNMKNISDLSEVFHITTQELILGFYSEAVEMAASQAYWNAKLNELTHNFTDEQFEKLYDYACLLSK